MKKVLVINTFGIGDVLFTTPFVAALKEQMPGVSVSYLGNARTAPFLACDPGLDKVFSYERDEFVAVYRKSLWCFLLKWKALVDDLRRERFEAAFDLSMGSPVGIALMLAGVPVRVGYDYKGRGRWLTRKVPFKGYEGRHVAEYYFDLLNLQPSNLNPRPAMSIVTSVSDDAWADAFMRDHKLVPGKPVIMFPGGGASWGKGASAKRWPAAGYAKLGDKIIEKASCPIILMGDLKEADLCQSVAEAMRHPVVLAAGQTTVTQSAALMKRARFVVANDGGPLHVAVASGVRTVSIFGPVDPMVYGPYPADGHRVVTQGLPCQPCYRQFRMSDCSHHRCLTTLTAEQVFSTVEEFL